MKITRPNLTVLQMLDNGLVDTVTHVAISC
jgi:hypothetical protein